MSTRFFVHKRWLSAAMLSVSVLLSSQAISQTNYPEQPIRLVVSFAAGGPTDTFARLIAARLSDRLGEPVVVENKPGGGSNIGSAFVARSKPDGYTLLLGTVANTTNMGVYQNMGYDTIKDFEHITQIMSSPSLLIVSNDLPVKTVQELIDYAKANPGKLSYASSGAGGMQHHAGEMLKLRTGIDVQHIPYKGAAPALNDVMSGRVQMGFKTASGVMPAVQAGSVRAIAVAGKTRLPQLPDVPTMAEAGFPGLEVDSWNGLFAPAGTPPEVVQKLADMTIEILNTPEIKERFAAISATPVGSTPEEFDAYVKAEVEKWSKVAREANVKIN